MGKQWLNRELSQVRGGGYGFDDALALLGFQRAGGVDEAAAGCEAFEGSGQDGLLAFGLACQLFGLQAEANLGVASEGASAAAGDVAEDQVEEVIEIGAGWSSGVFYGVLDFFGVGIAAESCLHLGETLGAYVG